MTTTPAVFVCSKKTAEKKLREGGWTHLISIGDPGEKGPYLGGLKIPRLRLEMHDCDRNDNPTHFPCPPTKEDVERIKRFAECNSSPDNYILIHCHAGISRSTATAFICFLTWGLEPEEAMKKMLGSCENRGVEPNKWMVEHADEVFDSNKKLINLWDEFFSHTGY